MRYTKTMSEALADVREGFSKKEIKMAIGIASDPRYKGGNYTGAFNAIEKIKKGLAKHPQVAAVILFGFPSPISIIFRGFSNFGE